MILYFYNLHCNIYVLPSKSFIYRKEERIAFNTPGQRVRNKLLQKKFDQENITFSKSGQFALVT